VKKLFVLLATLALGTSAAYAGCPGSGSMKDAKADQPVPQQTTPATRS
jgi:hypothetical protein